MILYLLKPQDLLNNYQISQPVKIQLYLAIEKLLQAIDLDSHLSVFNIIQTTLQELMPIETIPLEADSLSDTLLKYSQIQEFDQYMDIKHVQAKEPTKLIVASILTAYLGFQEILVNFALEPSETKILQLGFHSYAHLLTRVFNLETIIPEIKYYSTSSDRQNNTEDKNPINHSLEVWKKGHWVFSVLSQALIFCLSRFVSSFKADNLEYAKIEMETATQIMLASGASMKLAGNFNRHKYETEVRPTMTFNHPESLVISEHFSGLMMWDHDYLVNAIWKHQLMPIFKNLPSTLRTEHEKFILAYKEGLSLGHKSICKKFGGSEMASLVGSADSIALKNLDKFEHNRLKLIDPHK
jgi:hypothetical protein